MKSFKLKNILEENIYLSKNRWRIFFNFGTKIIPKNEFLYVGYGKDGYQKIVFVKL